MLPALSPAAAAAALKLAHSYARSARKQLDFRPKEGLVPSNFMRIASHLDTPLSALQAQPSATSSPNIIIIITEMRISSKKLVRSQCIPASGRNWAVETSERNWPNWLKRQTEIDRDRDRE